MLNLPDNFICLVDYGYFKIKKIIDNSSYKIELKIMGYPDRLFSSRNDYVFDIYSDRGLH